MTINNYRDAGFWELVLKCKEVKGNDAANEIKRALRAFYNKPVENPDTDGRVFNESIDGFIVVKPFPDDVVSVDDAEEFFSEYERIEYRPTYYDCTGQLFTSWHRVFKKPDGRFWLYHAVGRDV